MTNVMSLRLILMTRKTALENHKNTRLPRKSIPNTPRRTDRGRSTAPFHRWDKWANRNTGRSTRRNTRTRRSPEHIFKYSIWNQGSQLLGPIEDLKLEVLKMRFRKWEFEKKTRIYQRSSVQTCVSGGAEADEGKVTSHSGTVDLKETSSFIPSI